MTKPRSGAFKKKDLTDIKSGDNDRDPVIDPGQGEPQPGGDGSGSRTPPTRTSGVKDK